MSLFRIAWRSVQQRGFSSALTCLSMALGIMLVVSVLAIFGVVSNSFQNNSSLGYNLIVGANKGGKLQLTLNTVYYLSQPVENIPYHFFLEFMNKEQRDAELQNALRPERLEPGRAGRYAGYVNLVVPVCLGDYFGHFRVVGTTPDFFNNLTYGPASDKKYEFSSGRNFVKLDPEHGFYEAVVGATVAREKKLKVGDVIHATHGDPDGEGHGQGFTVVGILKPTGNPNDRAVFINMEGFYLLENHAKPLNEAFPDDAPPGDAPQDGAPQEDGAPSDARATKTARAESGKPLPVEQREVTALLVRTTDPLLTPGLTHSINKGLLGQAVLPIQEIYGLFEIFVTPIQLVLLVVTTLICVVSGVSILVSMYNSMSERKHEIAVMRALGADRTTITFVILLEAIILSLGGGVIGWVAGHALNTVASSQIEARTGVGIGFFDLAPGVDLMSIVGLETANDALRNLMLNVSIEFILIPSLVFFAILVGLVPALRAYHTDVAEALGD